METLHTIPGAYHGDAAALDDGWVAAAIVVEDIDEQFLTSLQAKGSMLRPGKTEADWMAAAEQAKRRLVAAVCRAGRIVSHDLAAAERIAGLACAGGPEPVVTWCQRDGGVWRLMLWDGSATRALIEQPAGVAHPAAARVADRLLIACECIEAGQERVLLFDGAGKRLAAVAGRRPRLAAGSRGGLLLVERVLGRESVGLVAYRIGSGRLGRPIAVPPADDYAFNADLACGPAGGFLVVHEACPAWNLDCRTGTHRDVCLWVLPPGRNQFRPAPGTCRAVLPLPRQAHFDLSAHNMPTIRPLAAVLDGRPAVAFRRVHFGGHRSYGWRLYLTRFDGTGWTAPARIAEPVSHGDSAYRVLAAGGKLLCFLPVCDVRCSITLAEQATGEPATGRGDHCRRAGNHRLEILLGPPEPPLPEEDIPMPRRAAYAIPPRLRGICPDPPDLPAAPKGLQLVWADLHPHSSYSKCLGPDDGFPQDVLRYQRDVLGCKVLSAVEHITLLSWPEFAHVYDRLEAEAAGRCAVIYGAEPGCGPAHHINFYAADRRVFDRLRELHFLRHEQSEVFPRIKQALPAGSVIVARHGHGTMKGEFSICCPEVTRLYDAELELAMEAMQLRGDMMLDLNWRVVKSPHFPSNYLNAGARIALLAGTDHANPPGPNHYCLTGLWVSDLTGPAAFQAIKDRRTLVCSNGKVAIWAELNGQPIGREVAVRGPVRIRAHLSAGTDILRVCLLRDGQLLPWQEVGARQATVELTDDAGPGYHWYVITAQAVSALARQPATAQTSPFFVTVS